MSHQHTPTRDFRANYQRCTLLAGRGLLAGIGLTMALFIANLSISESLIDSAKSGGAPPEDLGLDFCA